jgi:hypothetical protein
LEGQSECKRANLFNQNNALFDAIVLRKLWIIDGRLAKGCLGFGFVKIRCRHFDTNKVLSSAAIPHSLVLVDIEAITARG